MKDFKFIIENIPVEWTGKYFDEAAFMKWIQEKWDKERKEFICFMPRMKGLSISMWILFKVERGG